MDYLWEFNQPKEINSKREYVETNDDFHMEKSSDMNIIAIKYQWVKDY